MKHAKGYILVAYPVRISKANFHAMLHRHGTASIEELHPSLRVHKVRTNPGDEALMVAQMQQDPDVEFAELDEEVETKLGTLNDPNIPSAYHLTKINAATAWDKASGVGIVVAVVDGGVQPNHPDLAANTLPGWNVYDNNNASADITGHGTAVAGVIAAVGNNGIMGAGVAYAAKILPIRATDPAGGGTFSSAANGIMAASDRGANIVNISWSNLYKSSTVLAAAEKFRTARQGITVVSANNNGIDENVAATDSMVVVSGTQADDSFWPSSSFGRMVDVCAPALQVPTILWNSGYGWGTGTSFATPIVAGVCALIKSVRPDLTAAQVVQVLCASAKDLGGTGFDTKFGYGRVDAAAAVLAALAFGQVPTSPPPPPSGSTNVAAASAGARATASSQYSAAYPVSAINNGDRKGLLWSGGGGWNDATADVYPDWVRIDFNGAKTIDRVIVYTLQDNYGHPVEPTDTQTFRNYGVTDFTVEGLDSNGAWKVLGTVSGNNLVKRTVSFAAYTTTAVRVNISRAKGYSRLVEVEAWTV